MNTSSGNCSIAHTELQLMVACSGLAILSGAIAIVVVVHLKLCLKPMYRLVLYQVLLTILASAMFIACGGILMYKGNVCCIINNASWKILYNLALVLVYLQITLAYIMLIFLIRHFNELWCKMRKTLCIRSKWIFEHKYSADIFGFFFSIIPTTIFGILIFATENNGFWTKNFIYTIHFVYWMEINSILISIIVFGIFIQYFRVKEMKPLFNKLFLQLFPFLGYPAMTVVIVVISIIFNDNKSFSITPSIWCCTSNIILAAHVTIILCTKRNVTPRKALSEIGEHNELNHSIADNIKSSTYFSIPVED